MNQELKRLISARILDGADTLYLPRFYEPTIDPKTNRVYLDASAVESSFRGIPKETGRKILTFIVDGLVIERSEQLDRRTEEVLASYLEEQVLLLREKIECLAAQVLRGEKLVRTIKNKE